MLRHLFQRWALAACVVCLGTSPSAQTVTLRFPDGSFEVSGPLLSFDGAAYRVETRFGVLTIAADQVECEGDCPALGDAPIIRLAGAPAVADVLLPSLVDAFARSLGVASAPVAVNGSIGLALVAGEGREIARFEIAPMPTAEAFAAMARGGADIVLADRPVTEGERQAILDAELGDVAAPLRRRMIARQRLGFFAAEDVALPSLTVAQLLALTRPGAAWADVGGPEVAVSLGAEAGFEEAATARLAELAEIVGVEAGRLIGDAAPNALLATSSPLSPISLSHGCEPGSADGAEGDAYPLMLHFWAYTAAPRLPDLGRAFLIFAGGPDAQRVVDRAGFIDKRPRPIPLAAQGDRIARAVTELSAELSFDDLRGALERLRGYDRLSTVFRFAPGDRSLTAESRNEAASLADVLDAGRFDGRELIFVGLTDSTGPSEGNQRLSAARANRARDAVRAAMATQTDRVEMVAEGFGELLPLACDAGAWGQHVNRRVEVWLGPEE
ncbi:MAG: OmpA family protein [Pseudomonadota bacterium]